MKCTGDTFGRHIQCQVGISVLYREGVRANHRNRLKFSFTK